VRFRFLLQVRKDTVVIDFGFDGCGFFARLGKTATEDGDLTRPQPLLHVLNHEQDRITHALSCEFETGTLLAEFRFALS